MSDAPSGGVSTPTATASGDSNANVSGKRVYIPENSPLAKNEESPPAPSFKGTRHRVKYEGQESEVDYDELVKGYQQAQASTRRFQEASKMQSQSQQILQKLEEGDVNFLVQKLGPEKAQKVFEDYLIQQMEFDALPESEKRVRHLERQNKELLTEKQRFQQQKEEEQKASYLDKAHQDIDTQVSEALMKLGKKPTPRVVLRVVDDMIARLKDDSDGWDADSAAKAAIGSIHRDINDYLSDMPASELMQILPPQVLKTIREHQVSQVLDDRSKVRVKSDKSGASVGKKSKGFADAFAEIEKRFAR